VTFRCYSYLKGLVVNDTTGLHLNLNAIDSKIPVDWRLDLHEEGEVVAVGRGWLESV
jgi:hypothetical protein